MKFLFAIIIYIQFYNYVLAQMDSIDVTDLEEIFVIVEENAIYPGGQGVLLKEVAQNLIYPSKAKEEGIEGKVHLKFVVNEDGSVSNIQIIKDIGGGCGQAAVEAVQKLSKKFNPGKQRGVPAKVFFILPVQFSLDQLRGFYHEFDEEPKFKGGKVAFYQFLVRKLGPSYIKNCNFEGASMRMSINKLGEVFDISIDGLESQRCSDKLSAIILHNTNWEPGRVRGERAQGSVTYPLNLIYKVNEENY